VNVAGEMSILDLVNERLQSDDTVLPVFAPVAERVRRLVANPEFEISVLEEIVQEDPGLTSELLRMANSAFFRGLDKVATVRDAVMRLGASRVSELVTLVSQRATFRSRSTTVQHWMTQLWRHAVATSIGSRWLAERSGFGDMAQEAFLAGLLHDVGKLFLLKVIDDLASAGKLPRQLSAKVVLELIDRLHTQQGYLLLRRCEAPDVYCEAARDHHAASFDPTNGVLVSVRIANAACRKLGLGLHHDPTLVLAATPEAQCIGASEVLLAELEVLLEDAMDLAA
jgi:HD-like signal output (HDOD) protein